MPGKVERFARSDYDNQTKSQQASLGTAAGAIATQYRTVAAEFIDGGSVAVFRRRTSSSIRSTSPTTLASTGWAEITHPHRTAMASACASPPKATGVSSPGSTPRREPSSGWACFYLLSGGKRTHALGSSALHARRQYLPLPGYKTFTSHYHIEHTLDLLKRPARASGTE